MNRQHMRVAATALGLVAMVNFIAMLVMAMVIDLAPGSAGWYYADALGWDMAALAITSGTLWLLSHLHLAWVER